MVDVNFVKLLLKAEDAEIRSEELVLPSGRITVAITLPAVS